MADDAAVFLLGSREKSGDSRVIKGMLKLSQVRMNREALSAALMSRHPAMALGWLAMTPTDLPLRRIKAVMIFLAKYCWYSITSPLSAKVRMISIMS